MNHWWSCITKAQQDPHEAAADVYRTEVEGYDGGRDRTKEREKEREKLVYEYFILFFFFSSSSDFTCSCMWNLVSNDARNARPYRRWSISAIRTWHIHTAHGRVCVASRLFSLSPADIHKLKLHSNPVGCCGYRTRWNARRRRGRRRKLHSPPVTVGRGMMSI